MENKQIEEEETKKEIIQKIKELDSVDNKFKTIAINHQLEKKKALDSALEKEMRALTLKYEIYSKPIYKDCADIISGARGVKAEEIEKMGDVLNEEEQKQSEEQQNNKKAMKGYWAAALKNCDMIAPEIKEKDEEILEYLENIEYVPDESNPLKFDLIFTFEENDHFDNTVVKKSMELTADDEPKKGYGDELNWKEGKNITVKTIKKTQKNKKSGAKRVVTKEVDDESFFNFFKEAEAAEGEVDEDDEEAMIAEEKMAIDFDIARGFVDEVIPYSLEYYLGVKTADGEDYEDDDDEDCSKEEDCSQLPCCTQKKQKKKAHKKSSDSSKSNEGKEGEKPECKQQ